MAGIEMFVGLFPIESGVAIHNKIIITALTETERRGQARTWLNTLHQAGLRVDDSRALRQGLYTTLAKPASVWLCAIHTYYSQAGAVLSMTDFVLPDTNVRALLWLQATTDGSPEWQLGNTWCHLPVGYVPADILSGFYSELERRKLALSPAAQTRIDQHLTPHFPTAGHLSLFLASVDSPVFLPLTAAWTRETSVPSVPPMSS